MTESLLRREIKKAVDRLAVDRLPSLADYIAFLNHPTLGQQLKKPSAISKRIKALIGTQPGNDISRAVLRRRRTPARLNTRSRSSRGVEAWPKISVVVASNSVKEER